MDETLMGGTVNDPRRKVTALEAGIRGLGESYASSGRTLAAAGSAPFVLADKLASLFTGHPVTGAEDWAFDKLQPAFDAPKYYQIDPQHEVLDSGGARIANMVGKAAGTVQQMAAMPGGAGLTGFRAALAEGAPALARLAGGAVPGTITRAAPAIVPPAVDTEQHILDAGGSTGTALKGALATAGTNAAMSFLPLSMPGSWITRGLTGGAVGAAGTAPQAALNNWALGDDPNAQGLKQPLLNPEAMGQNALVQGLMGVIGGKTPDVPVNGLIKPFMEKARELLTPKTPEITPEAIRQNLEAIKTDFQKEQLQQQQMRQGFKENNPNIDDADIKDAIRRASEIPSTHSIDTPERQALREQIADKLYANGAASKSRRLDIVMGLPASGKSTRAAEPLAKQHGSMVIDSDFAKELLPEYSNGIGAGAVHHESSGIIYKIFGRALKAGDNIVYPTVGSDLASLEKLIEVARRNKYQVHVTHVKASPQAAKKRVIERFRGTGRFINPEYIDEVGLRPEENFAKIKAKGAADGYSEFSNEKDAPPDNGGGSGTDNEIH